MSAADLSYFTRGNIPSNFKKEISDVLNDCYKRFGHRAPYKIEIFIFDTQENLNSFLREEKFKLGLSFNAIDEVSACTYEVLRGYPRLLICQERLAPYSKAGRAGAIRHEAAHTVLHGSLEYSIFQIPEDCRHIAMVKGIEPAKLEELFFQLSMGVKDFETTRFLVEHDYIACQFSYALEWIKPADDDRTAWNISRTNRQTRFVYESALMRPILFCDPLLSLPKSRKTPEEDRLQLDARIEQMISFLGETEENKVLKVAGSIIEVLGNDTHENIDAAFHQLINLI
ncbi:MAG: hypothetical protein JXA01_06650 [Dehalococcoidia bacterium]|nr:hypothetical protein [Dehalococcoidia bacterium]